MAEKKKPAKLEFINKRAAFEYFFDSTYEAGIVLTGTEIKSIRLGHINLRDSYCLFKKGELYVYSLYIKEYEFGTHTNHEPRRVRKLLLRKTELKKLEKRVKERGYTIVPYRLYLSERGFCKLEIALSTGKKSHDKRQSIKEKDAKRDIDRMKKANW